MHSKRRGAVTASVDPLSDEQTRRRADRELTADVFAPRTGAEPQPQSMETTTCHRDTTMADLTCDRALIE